MAGVGKASGDAKERRSNGAEHDLCMAAGRLMS